MKFSIRDLLWLMATVALAAVVYADRVQMQRTAAKWDEATELQAQRTAAEMRGLRATISELSEHKRILQHQIADADENSASNRPDEKP